MQTLGGVSEYLINGRKNSTRAEVARAGGCLHGDKKSYKNSLLQIRDPEHRADKELSRAVNQERFDPNVQ